MTDATQAGLDTEARLWYDGDMKRTNHPTPNSRIPGECMTSCVSHCGDTCQCSCHANQPTGESTTIHLLDDVALTPIQAATLLVQMGSSVGPDSDQHPMTAYGFSDLDEPEVSRISIGQLADLIDNGTDWSVMPVDGTGQLQLQQWYRDSNQRTHERWLMVDEDTFETYGEDA